MDNSDVSISPELGAAVTIHDPCQEILDPIGGQGCGGRSSGYRTLVERSKMMDEARFQELKANIKIMEQAIRTSYIRSPKALLKMNNGELRTHFLLCREELHDKLQGLEVELLHCTTTASLLDSSGDIDLRVMKQIVNDCRAESEITTKCLMELIERREVAMDGATFSRARLPSFSGVWHGNNMYDFKRKLIQGLTKMEVPEADWGYWLLERLSGPAIVTIKSLHHDISKMDWNEIWECLELSFGEESYLREKMIQQHHSAGKMSELYGNTNLRKRACRLQHHLSLINETLELSCLVGNHREEIIDSRYANNLMNTLAASDRLTVRRKNEAWECLGPMERTLVIQQRMEDMLEECMTEAAFQKVSCYADENPATGFDPPSDDPSETDTNPSPYQTY